MGILLFELFRNPLFMGILNKWETLVFYTFASRFNILRAEVLNDISVCRRLTTTTIDSRTKIH